MLIILYIIRDSNIRHGSNALHNRNNRDNNDNINNNAIDNNNVDNHNKQWQYCYDYYHH